MYKENTFNKMVRGLIILVLLISFSFGFVVFSNAENTTPLQEVNFTVDDYTKSDNLLNADGTESLQKIDVFAKTSQSLIAGMKINDIEKVIPVEYLESSEYSMVFQHNGLEYGFYLVKEGECFDLLIIDFTYESNDSYEYKIKIKPILQISFQRLFVNGEYSWYKISNELRAKYFVANPRFVTYLLNENELNYGDSGYLKANDNGMIIRQSRFNYGSFVYKNELDLVVECFEYGIKYSLDSAVDDTLTALDAIAPGVGKVLGNVKDIVEFGWHLYDEGNNTETKVRSNENNILSNTTRDAQRANTDVDGFTRIAGISPLNKIILSDDSTSYAEFIVMLEGADTKSRLVQACDFEIVHRVDDWQSMSYVEDEYGNPQVFSIGKEQTLFQNASITQISSSNHQNNLSAYMLDNGTQIFRFKPQVTTTYSFHSTSPLSDIKVYLQGKLVEKNIISENEIEVKLEANNEYRFVFSQVNAGFYKFVFGQKAIDIGIGDSLSIPQISFDETISFVYTNDATATQFLEFLYEDSLYEVMVYVNGTSQRMSLIKSTDMCQFTASPQMSCYIQVRKRTNSSQISCVTLGYPTALNIHTMYNSQHQYSCAGEF